MTSMPCALLSRPSLRCCPCVPSEVSWRICFNSAQKGPLPLEREPRRTLTGPKSSHSWIREVVQKVSGGSSRVGLWSTCGLKFPRAATQPKTTCLEMLLPWPPRRMFYARIRLALGFQLIPRHQRIFVICCPLRGKRSSFLFFKLVSPFSVMRCFNVFVLELMRRLR